jgi:transposase
MSVYRVQAMKASCRVWGCACHERVPCYPWDLTDAQWALLRPEAEVVMAELRRSPAGRPMEHDLRAVLDAIGYLTRYGIEWRALPVDFPAVGGGVCLLRTVKRPRSLPQGLVDRLRGRLRVAYGRADLPIAGSIDSQSVQAAETVGGASRGYDGGKKINGRKRHIAVDTLGLLLSVIVTAASVQDRDGAFRLLALLRERFSTISLVWADGGYAGRLVNWAHQVLALTLTVDMPDGTGLALRFGEQLDTQTVNSDPTGELTPEHAARYIAKYATKSAGDFGLGERRITPEALPLLDVLDHVGQLVRVAWQFGEHHAYEGLRRWVHMLGFRGRG